MVQPIPVPNPEPPSPGAAAGGVAEVPVMAPRPDAVRTPWWLEALLVCLLAGICYGVVSAATRWNAPLASGVTVDLSPSRLPLYAGLSTLRMVMAYVISLTFSLAYARVAASSRAAERVMLPVLDILQSVPILSFMPGVVIALAALFPGRTLGLEIAAIILIFTSQAWNLAFSFHQSLMTVPTELHEAAAVYQLGPWRRFLRLELPFGTIALIQNSMMSWAGGWFFLMASEQFVLGKNNFRLPGLGSYLARATEVANWRDVTLGIATLVLVIVLLDQLLWRPLVAWSDRFKFEQSAGDVPRSWVLDAVRGSATLEWVGAALRRTTARILPRRGPAAPRAERTAPRRSRARLLVIVLILGGLTALIVWGALSAVRMLSTVHADAWAAIGIATLATLGRTLAALVIAAAWTIPTGVAIGTNPAWSRRLQPIVQIVASVPATAIFPVILIALLALPGGLSMAAIALMLLGTQWYVLFNVIAGAMAIPSDLREAAATYHIVGWRRWKTLILPAIFPYLITGMITAMGGAWNASIVSEYVTFGGHHFSTIGLGATIARAADAQNFGVLLAATIVMAGVVIAANRFVWRRLYRLAESRYRLG